MTAEPTCPGLGLPVYQPATDVLAGAWRVPCAVRPSLISRVWTSMAGMLRYTGRGTVAPVTGWGGATSTPAGGFAGCAIGPGVILGRAVGPVSSIRPAVPPPTASSPPQSSAAA